MEVPSSIQTTLTSALSLSDFYLSGNEIRAIMSDSLELNIHDLYEILKKCNEELALLNVENKLLKKNIHNLRSDAVAKIMREFHISETTCEQIQKFKKITTGTIVPSEKSQFSNLLRRSKSFESTGTLRLFPSFVSEAPSSVIPGILTSALASNQSLSPSETVTFAFRTAMIIREVESLKHSMSVFISWCKLKKNRYLNEVEERKIAINYILTSKFSMYKRFYGKEKCLIDNKPGNVILKGYQVIYAINEAIKNIFNDLQNISMRNSSLKKKVNKLRAKIEHMEDVGETIDELDLERLKISHENLKKEMKDKSECYLTFGRVVGYAKQKFNSEKRRLDKLENELKNINTEIQNKSQLFNNLQSEKDKLFTETNLAEKENKKTKHLLATQKAPDVLTYARIKSKLRETEKKIKVMTRKTEEQKKNVAYLRGKLKKLNSSNPGLILLPQKVY